MVVVQEEPAPVVVRTGPNSLQWLGIILQRVVYFIVDVVLTVLTVRFFLRFFGANPENDFVALIYSLTSPVVTPFSGIFAPVSSNATSAFEVSTILAMIVISVIAYAIARLIGIITVTRT